MRTMTDRIQQMLLRGQRDDFVLSPEAQQFLNRRGIIVRMRGLPYECSPKQVIDFFREGEQSCDVFDGENGILFVKKPDGRSTGDAFVQFIHESEVEAALSKHKELIGTRYIELFRTTPVEVEQVLRKAQENKPRVPVQLPNLVTPIPPTVAQHVITSGTKKDCIRLRGLPYEAQVEHILDFLGDNANNIVLQGVHMVYNVHGQPSGEAFIQMDSEASASQAANHCHHRYMNFGKKQRYVEVFQCSGDDMNALLTSGHVSPKATSVISPVYPWTSEEPFKSAANTMAVGADTMAKSKAADPETTIPGQPEVYSPYANPGQTGLYFLHPNVPRVVSSPAFPKPSFPPVPTPHVMFSQMTPSLTPMGMLGVKRSWEQAFPLETTAAAIQGAKRWPTPQIATFAAPGFFPDVG